MALLHRTEPGPEAASFRLSALLPALRWEPSEALARVLCVSSFRRLSEALGATVATLARSGEAEGELAALAMRDLPDAAFFRLLIAPELFTILSGASGRDGASQAEFLARSLQAERGRREGPPPRSVWTALGDQYLPADGDPTPPWQAPRLRFGLALDWRSPQVLAIEEPRCGPPLPWSDSDIERVQGALNRALDGLAGTAPAAAELVRTFTRVVVPRRDGLVADTFRSSSTNAAIGRSLLVNPHLPEVDELDLADALLHEGMHHALYTAELIRPMLLDKAACADTTCPSPWTGNPLSVHNYAHACLVWSGLWALWRAPAAAEHFDPVRVAARVAYLKQGFEAGPLRTALEPVQPHLDPDLLPLIDGLQAGVLGG